MSVLPFDQSAAIQRQLGETRNMAIGRLVLITDTVLEEDLLALIDEMGFFGHSSVECSCRSLGGFADNGLSRGRVRIEALGPVEIARGLMRQINDGMFRGYSIFTYLDSVEVDKRGALR